MKMKTHSLTKLHNEGVKEQGMLEREWKKFHKQTIFSFVLKFIY